MGRYREIKDAIGHYRHCFYLGQWPGGHQRRNAKRISSSRRQKCLERCSKRQIERHGPAHEPIEPKMLVEADHLLVLGVDDECENGGIGTVRATGGINDKGAAEALSPEALIDRQASDQGGRDQRIPRQPPRLIRRETRQGEAGGRKSVIARDSSTRGKRDKAVADAPADVLRCQFMKIMVERRNAAAKGFAVMGGGKGFDPELRRHSQPFISRRCAFAARSKAGAGSGGSIMAAAKAR